MVRRVRWIGPIRAVWQNMHGSLGRKGAGDGRKRVRRIVARVEVDGVVSVVVVVVVVIITILYPDSILRFNVTFWWCFVPFRISIHFARHYCGEVPVLALDYFFLPDTTHHQESVALKASN
jgi:hypothetical protein